MDWKREIFIAHLVRQKVAEVDVKGLWPPSFPEVAASDAEIGAVESVLGFKLNDSHREFLLHANGWKSFFQSVDVFGVEDLVSGWRFDRAKDLLVSMDDTKELSGFSGDDLLPIAVSVDDIDFFVISKKTSHTPGVVIWFAGQVIDKFSNFEDWFLAMVDYNRSDYSRMLERSEGGE